MRSTHNHQKSLFCQPPEHEYYKEWQAIEAILEGHSEFLTWVHDDLTQDLKERKKGAKGMTAEQVLRAAILKQSNCWTYRELEIQCVDSLMTRAFMKLDFDESYSFSCLQENIKRIKATTWEKISHALIVHAKDAGIENGKVIRVDATPIESNIHSPSDSSLLYDCIRDVNLQFEHLRTNYQLKIYTNVKTKVAKSLFVRIFNAKSADERVDLYRTLIKSTKSILARTEQVLAQLENKGFTQVKEFLRLNELAEMMPIIIDQTKRRVLKEELVPTEDKLFSIYEPHTDIIVKGQRNVVYGHKVFFTVGVSGLVLDTVLVQGNPSDTEYFMDLVERHKNTFKKYPNQIAADGGFASEDNLYDAKECGVKDVCFSKFMGFELEDMVKSRWVFEKLRNFRAGIESVISCLKRGYALTRATWKGVGGFGSYVHSAIVAYNLVNMAQKMSI